MSLHVEFDGIRDSETLRRIENAIRQCMGDPPADEEWITSVTSFGYYCRIVVQRSTKHAKNSSF